MMKREFLMVCVLGACFISFPSRAKTDFEIVKQRIVEELMKPPVDDVRIESLITNQVSDGTWPDINYLDVSREGFEHRFHLSNMAALGRAYKTRNSKFYKNKKVKSALELALENWVENDYICDNWWHNEIGTPDNLVTLMLVAGDILPEELVQKAQPIIGRAHIDAPGARPGGDRIKIAGIQAKNMLFIGDTQTFDKVVRVIESEIKFVEWIGAKYGYSFRRDVGGFENRTEGGRGIQYDNSFHHRIDGVNNTLSYGTGYASAFIDWAGVVAGTDYAFSTERINRLVDYYLDGICKHLVFGKFPDVGAKNRSISRENSLRAYDPSDVAKLLECTDYRRPELEEIKNTRTTGSPATLSHATFYWNTEHFTVQRPGWFASVRMYSTRNFNMEQPYNSEGLLNHHRGDGTNHISLSGTEYYDIAPVFDYQKIPGATIVQKAQPTAPEEIQKLGLTDFVGAATDGKYAAVGFDFKSPHDPLSARKAWFFFDKEYVCLGTGISAKQELQVATTLNQCLLRSDVKVSSQNAVSVIENGERVIENVNWVFHDGMGYIFPEPASVNLMNKQVTGSWWTINKQSDSPKGEIQKDVFKLWIDHGSRPSDASYEYIVSPGTTTEELRTGSSAKSINILSNTPEIQAVYHKDLNMAQVVFYTAGQLQMPNGLTIKSDSPGIFMLKMENNTVKGVTVADPNRELATIHFSISGKLDLTGEGHTARWNEEENITEISAKLPEGNYAGKSVTVELK